MNLWDDTYDIFFSNIVKNYKMKVDVYVLGWDEMCFAHINQITGTVSFLEKKTQFPNFFTFDPPNLVLCHYKNHIFKTKQTLNLF